MNENPIDKALGLRPIETQIEVREIETQEILPTEYGEDVDETLQDLELARSNIQDIMNHGGNSLQDMIDLAKQSESPRAFEVAATLMKTLLDANKDFVEISDKKKKHKNDLTKSPNSQTTNITNNNLIVSTAELLKQLKGGKD